MAVRKGSSILIDLTQYKKRSDETHFEWKLRLIKEHAYNSPSQRPNWKTIIDLLGEKVSVDHFRKYASGVLAYHEYLNSTDSVSTKILSISDLHYPFVKPLSALEQYKGVVDILQLNGDILDCTQLSKFPKSYRTNPIEEIIGARKYIIDLINTIQPKKVIANYGNHDLRLGTYLSKKLDNELAELLPETALDYIFDDGFTYYDKKTGTKSFYEPLTEVFSDIEIEYTGKWYSQIGEGKNSIIFAHPKAFASNPLKTAEKAMYFFRNEGFDFSTLVMAHTHRQGMYMIGDTTLYEQGAFCETDKMSYSNGQLINSQKQGYIYICIDNVGNVISQKTKLNTLN